MENYVIALICVAISIGGILIASCVKKIISANLDKINAKRASKKKEGETVKNLVIKDFELLLAFIAMVFAYFGVVVFLKYGILIDTNVVFKLAAPYAVSTQGLYIFVVQLSRKGIKGIVAGIIHLVSNIKKSNKPVQDAPTIIQEAAENADNINEPADEDVKKIVSEVRNFFNK